MAEYALIDAYLDIVGRRLGHRTDAADLRDELADHLLLSVNRSENGGLDREIAQRTTLDRFGDPLIVAALLAAVPAKGIDMVSALSRTVGVLSIVAAISWIALIFVGPNGLVAYLDRSWSTDEYAVQAIAQGTAVLVTGVALVALNVRVAGRVDSLTGLVIGAMVFALASSVVMAWAFFVWAPFFAAAIAITVARLDGTPTVKAPIASVLLVVVVPILLVLGSLASLQYLMSGASEAGTSQDLLLADLVAFAVSGVIFLLLAAGLGFLGFRLRAGTSYSHDGGPAAIA